MIAGNIFSTVYFLGLKFFKPTEFKKMNSDVGIMKKLRF